MPRTDFDRSLQEIQDELLVLGSMVEKSIDRSVMALKNRDLPLSKTVIDDDDLIDDLRNKIEEKCISVIATQNPMAGDLRTVISVLYIAEELERMGDYAEGIAKISLSIGKEPMLKPLVDIPRMAEKSSKMLSRSLDALVNRDEQLAIQVCRDDNEVDAVSYTHLTLPTILLV